MSMYASVLTLNANDLHKLRVSDSYSLHRVVYSLFNREDETRILYSDQKMKDGQRRVYLLAHNPPSDRTPEGYGSVRTTELSDELLSHSAYQFKVVINPTYMSNKKIVPIKGRENIAQWFIDKAPRWGFSADQIQVENIDVESFNSKHGHPVVLAYATVTGTLEVTNKALFEESFQKGLGRGKAFGCGLLQIAPIAYQPFM